MLILLWIGIIVSGLIISRVVLSALSIILALTANSRIRMM